jgi:protein SCO1/2
MNEAMPSHRSRPRPILASLVMVLLALLGACSGTTDAPPLQGAAIGGPFALTDQNGHTVRDTDFAGRYRLIYFGYSFCPDVCPTDLQAIGQGLSRFEKKAPERAMKVQPIFITVDPERDTPPVLKEYVAAFHPRLIGLTGSPAQIAAVSKAYGVYSAKQQGSGKARGYLVDHSRQAILFGPEGEPMVLVPQDEGAAAIAAALDTWVK